MDSPRFDPFRYRRPGAFQGRSPSSEGSSPVHPSDMTRLGRRLLWCLVGAGLALAVFGSFSLSARLRPRREAISPAEGDAAARPGVQVVRVRQAPKVTEESLPGTIHAAREAAVHFHGRGHVRRVLARVGDRVKAGDVLAEVEVPELGHDIDLARAELAEARARLTRVPSGPEADERRAAVAAREARLRKLEDLRASCRVRAPIDGVITERHAVAGARAADDTPELFHLIQPDALLVRLRVPERLATQVRLGQKARVKVPSLSGQGVPGEVTLTAPALDPRTRRMTAEVGLPPGTRDVMPGMPAEVTIFVPREGTGLLVPVAALLMRDDQQHVAVIDKDNVLHYRPVSVVRPAGKEAEVRGELTEKDSVAVGLEGEPADGTVVERAK